MHPAPPAPTVTALGMFDGVHIGHRRILEQTVSLAAGHECLPAVFSFVEHPATVLAPDRAPRILTSADARRALFLQAGIEYVELIHFDLPFSHRTPEDFVRDIVVGRMRAKAVVVGYNYHFGHKRAGTPDVLRALGEQFNFEVHVVPPYETDGQPVSSSRIRQLIQAGRVSDAARLLGREVELFGKVIAGSGMARKLGYPTANVLIDKRMVMVGEGIYAVSLPPGVLGPQRMPGIAYNGKRSTIPQGHPPDEVLAQLLEVHLFDWEGDLSGRELRVDLHAKLRDDQHFPNVESLLAQIDRDCQQAREWSRAADTVRPGA